MHKLPPQAQTRRIEAKTVVIYDDVDHGHAWSRPLTDSGIDTVAIPLDEETIPFLAGLLPDLIVLEDFNHKPEELALCAHLRQETPIPILLLTVRGDEEFHLRAYQAGVDECIALPINPQLFVAKVRAWLGRTLSLPASAVNEISCGAFRLEPAHRRLALPSGQVLKLTNLELRLLLILMAAPGEPVNQAVLIERVWGPYGGGDRTMLKNVVYRLRRKIEPEPQQPRHLVTVNHSDYRFLG